MKALLSKFRRDEDGAALVEYGIALLVVILVGTGALLGLSLTTPASLHRRVRCNRCVSSQHRRYRPTAAGC
jgi:Flp pilus assembly pilin Flp